METVKQDSTPKAEQTQIKYSKADGELFNMLSGWKLNQMSENTIRKDFILEDFEKVIDFVYDIAQIAVINGYNEILNASGKASFNSKCYRVKIEVSKSDYTPMQETSKK